MRSMRVVVTVPLPAPDPLLGFVRVPLSGAMAPYILRLPRPPQPVLRVTFRLGLLFGRK